MFALDKRASEAAAARGNGDGDNSSSQLAAAAGLRSQHADLAGPGGDLRPPHSDLPDHQRPHPCVHSVLHDRSDRHYVAGLETWGQWTEVVTGPYGGKVENISPL